jgi:DnaJ-class molecular chaperone
MPRGLCRCANGHAWETLVEAYGDNEGVRISQMKCPTCAEFFSTAIEGRYLTPCSTCKGSSTRTESPGSWVACKACQGTGVE